MSSLTEKDTCSATTKHNISEHPIRQASIQMAAAGQAHVKQRETIWSAVAAQMGVFSSPKMGIPKSTIAVSKDFAGLGRDRTHPTFTNCLDRLVSYG